MKLARIPFILIALICLIVGLLAGLQRIGWTLSFSTIHLQHGAIMIGGFLGTLISFEKIIPLKQKELFILPMLSGASVLFYAVGRPELSTICLLVASAGLGIVFSMYWFRERSIVYTMMILGAFCWTMGNLMLIISGYPAALSWWMAFILLIITSERIELMKFLPVPQRQKIMFIGILSLFLIACIISFHGIGIYFASFSLIGASAWLMRFDIVSINLKKTGFIRFLGVALLSGYIALLLNGILLLLMIHRPLGYDLLIHSYFLGFVFAMIFAHGPMILPGVLGISIKPYHPILYCWLFLLHTSWLMRAFADTILNMEFRKYSGILSAIAILGYFVSLAIITIRSQRAKTL